MNRSPQQHTDEASLDSYARLQDNSMAKNVYFYKDGDTTVGALRVAIHPKKYRSMDSLLSDLSKKMPGLSFGVRSIYTPGGRDVVKSVERFENEGRYVCSTYKNKARGVDILKVQPPPPWHAAKPRSGQREFNRLLKDDSSDDTPLPQPPVKVRPFRSKPLRRRFIYARSRGASDSSGSRASTTPKRMTLIRNTEHSEKHVILLNRRTAQTFDQVLIDISGLFRMPVRRLFTLEGLRINSLSAIFNGPEHYVVCGKEVFRPFEEVYVENQRLSTLRHRRGKQGGPTVANALRERRERLSRTRGRWRIWITTNELPQASCSAQVSITVYGERGNSGPIPLGDADDETFQAGTVDEFESLNLKDKLVFKLGEISVGNIGSIYKVRVAHDNSTDHPGWFCEEVAMRDMQTEEELVFKCNRWLSRDEDDCDICRELPAVRPRESVLPLLKYRVTVVTGDYWNAGTDAHVYMTIYGERGDTGVRQLYKSTNSLHSFQKGQSDTFQLEAVSLGALRRVIIGHDGDGPGNGWYLDKIFIREGHKSFEECVFPCGRWLDESEDDKKIVRELKIQDEYMHDQLEKEMWDYEKWKYGPNCQIMLFSKLTRKALRIGADGHVDGLGEVENDESILSVVMRKGTARMLKSSANGKYLTINEHRVTSMIRHGPASELKLKVQPDRSVKLQSLKNLLHLTVRKDGHVGDPRGGMSDPSTAFIAYCKGMFRTEGVIMLCTSLTQTVAIQHDNNLYGTGKRNRMAHFIVHKVDEGGIRMFESACFPDQYIKMKDGQCDCQGTGDSSCHFRVHRYREQGFVMLESVNSRGLFMGLTPDGQIRPTVNTGEKNVRLFPEVLRFGRPKEGERLATPSPDLIPLTPHSPPRSVRKSRTPRRTKEEHVLHLELSKSRSRSRSRSKSRSRSRSPKRMNKKKSSARKVASKHEVEELKQEEEDNEGEWRVWLETGEEKNMGLSGSGSVLMYAYGEYYHIGPIIIGSGKDGVFQSGQLDEFKINLSPSMGDLYKVRIGHDEQDVSGWYLEKLKMQNLKTKELLTFHVNRWMSRSEDDYEVWRELPVERPGAVPLPVMTYVIHVYTGTLPASETEANVYMNIFGSRGDSGMRTLYKNINGGDKFKRGAVDIFHLEAVHLGDLQKIHIGHDGEEAGAGWYLEKLVVIEPGQDSEENITWNFPCQKWFDEGLDDKTLSREIEVDTRATYILEVYTGDKMFSGTDANVYVQLIGGEGDTGRRWLKKNERNKDKFETGEMDIFRVTGVSVGELTELVIGHDGVGRASGWYLDKVIVKLESNEETSWEFQCDRWLDEDEDDGLIERSLKPTTAHQQ